MKFKDNLKALREGNGRSMKFIAEKTGLTIAAISQFEKGTRHPSVFSLVKIADFFKVSTDYLLGRKTNNEKFKSVMITGNFEMITYIPKGEQSCQP